MARDGLQLGQKSFVDDRYSGVGIVEDIFVVVRLGLGVDRNGHRADFDGPEEGVEKFGGVEKQEEHSVIGTHAQIAKCVADAVGALEELLVSDTLVATFDGDILRAAFQDVVVHEVSGDVEELGQSDQVATWLAGE